MIVHTLLLAAASQVSLAASVAAKTASTPPVVYAPPPPPTHSSVPTYGARGPNMPASPQNDPGRWITSDDYPSSALRQELTGTTVFDIRVNRWGGLADCVILQSSGHVILDEEACRVINRRARFFPATDGQGKPIAGSYTSRIKWVIPDTVDETNSNWPRAITHISTDTFPRGPRLLTPLWSKLAQGDYPQAALAAKQDGASLLTLTLDASGSVTGCSVRLSSGHAELDAKACAIANERAKFSAALDLSGKPVAGRALTGIDWRLGEVASAYAQPLAGARNYPGLEYRPRHIIREAGAVSVDYLAKADGSIDGCTSSVTGADLGTPLTQICDLVARNPDLKFQPLTDDKGNAVDRRVKVRVNFNLEPVISK
jgi:TonB family protein